MDDALGEALRCACAGKHLLKAIHSQTAAATGAPAHEETSMAAAGECELLEGALDVGGFFDKQAQESLFKALIILAHGAVPLDEEDCRRMGELVRDAQSFLAGLHATARLGMATVLQAAAALLRELEEQLSRLRRRFRMQADLGTTAGTRGVVVLAAGDKPAGTTTAGAGDAEEERARQRHAREEQSKQHTVQEQGVPQRQAAERERAAQEAAARAAQAAERERAAAAAAAAEAALLAELEGEERQAAEQAQRKAAKRQARKQRQQARLPAKAASLSPSAPALAGAVEEAGLADGSTATSQQEGEEESGKGEQGQTQQPEQGMEPPAASSDSAAAAAQLASGRTESASVADKAAAQPEGVPATRQPGNNGRRLKGRPSKTEVARGTAEKPAERSPAGKQAEARGVSAAGAATAAANGRSVHGDAGGLALYQAQQAQQAQHHADALPARAGRLIGSGSSSSSMPDKKLLGLGMDALPPGQPPAKDAEGQPGTPRKPRREVQVPGAAALAPLTPAVAEQPGSAAAAAVDDARLIDCLPAFRAAAPVAASASPAQPLAPAAHRPPLAVAAPEQLPPGAAVQHSPEAAVQEHQPALAALPLSASPNAAFAARLTGPGMLGEPSLAPALAPMVPWPGMPPAMPPARQPPGAYRPPGLGRVPTGHNTLALAASTDVSPGAAAQLGGGIKPSGTSPQPAMAPPLLPEAQQQHEAEAAELAATLLTAAAAAAAAAPAAAGECSGPQPLMASELGPPGLQPGLARHASAPGLPSFGSATSQGSSWAAGAGRSASREAMQWPAAGAQPSSGACYMQTAQPAEWGEACSVGQSQSGSNNWLGWPASRQSSAGSVPGLLGPGDDLLIRQTGQLGLQGADDAGLPPLLDSEAEEHAGWGSAWGRSCDTAGSSAAAAGQEWVWEEHSTDAGDQAGAGSAQAGGAGGATVQLWQGRWQALLEAPAAQPARQPLALPGLRNAVGEYNCFLNAVVQCLWRCAAFRQEVLSWLPSFYEAHPVVAALRHLFEQLGRQQAAAAGVGPAAAPAASRAVVDPAELRVALSGASERTFGLGEMNDASEVLLTIYESIQAVEQAQHLPGRVEPLMGLPVEERVYCPACELVSHRSSYTQHFYNAQAAGMQELLLRTAEQRRRGILGANTMGKRLRALAELYKSCDEDRGGCGAKRPVAQRLQRAPRVFTLQLAWRSHLEAPEDIGAALRALDSLLSLDEVYQGEAAAGRRYRLRSLVGYSGQHYSAFVALPELGGEFAQFDDAQVTRASDWEAVVRRCEAGRIQPSVLFYEAEE